MAMMRGDLAQILKRVGSKRACPLKLISDLLKSVDWSLEILAEELTQPFLTHRNKPGKGWRMLALMVALPLQ
ncbi:hypothetical protein [Nonomuraea sp. NPDC049607]|uniref:hypothetical protein n=1 Tax=Nonomuraea sp. NPDC049607 TaxID=3154732 RepID=UPI00342B5597